MIQGMFCALFDHQRIRSIINHLVFSGSLRLLYGRHVTQAAGRWTLALQILDDAKASGWAEVQQKQQSRTKPFHDMKSKHEHGEGLGSVKRMASHDLPHAQRMRQRASNWTTSFAMQPSAHARKAGVTFGSQWSQDWLASVPMRDV